MSKTRKVHRFGFAGQGIAGRRWARRPTTQDGRLHTKAACGVYLYPDTPNCGFGVPDLVFNAFSTEQRCWTCESKSRHLTAPRAVAVEWLATVEVLVLALSRLGREVPR